MEGKLVKGFKLQASEQSLDKEDETLLGLTDL